MVSQYKILVIDDDESAQKYFSIVIPQLGHQYFGLKNPSQLLEILENKKPAIIILDLVIPGDNGIQILKVIKEFNRNIVVIILTAYASIKTSVEAIKAGALDYVEKPITKDDLEILLNKASQFVILTEENQKLKNQLEATYDLGQVCTKSNIMKDILGRAMQIAKTDTSVLILGESGTGKELIARTIHSNSLRKSQLFIPVNCAALPDNLLESELFGHEKGAFTGAFSKKRGLFEYANKGTIFLDEIAEMNFAFQAKLLRFLEDFTFRRVGGNQLRETNVRVICATNHDPIKSIEKNKLREDLYYRINGITIELPPLRDRREDIIALIDFFVIKYCVSNNITEKQLDKQAVEILQNYSWPGNVRELKNIIQQMISLSKNTIITKRDIPDSIIHVSRAFVKDNHKIGTYKEEKERILTQFEEEYFRKLLRLSGGNISKSAEIAQLTRKTIYNILNKHELINV